MGDDSPMTSDRALAKKPEAVVIGSATLYLGDCLDVLPHLPVADVLITDPPYSAKTHAGARGRGATTGGAHILVDFEAFTGEHFAEVVLPAMTAKARRWSVVFTDWSLARHVDEGQIIRMGVWVKNDPAPQFTGDRPGTGWESLMLLHPPGRKRWNGGGRPAVWRSNICKNGNEHPTQKPDDLMLALVRDFSEPGEVILDPFMGSGSTGVAALRAGRAFVGIERDAGHFETACRRIDQAQRQPNLFPEALGQMEQEALL
jgi:site-specific DNA-methyltransferase (adenine-specific)